MSEMQVSLLEQRKRRYYLKKKEWIQKNRERHLEAQRIRNKRWKLKNKDKIKEYAKNNRDKINEYKRKWRTKNKERLLEYRKRYKKSKEQYELRNKPKTSARHAVLYAIRTGKLIKPKKCTLCNSERLIHGHHEDYSKKLDVIWVCEPCHVMIHNKKRRNGDG